MIKLNGLFAFVQFLYSNELLKTVIRKQDKTSVKKY